MISDLCCKTGHQKHRAFCFWNFACKKFLGDPPFSSSLNVSPRSALNFKTETKRCRSDFQYCWHWLTWPASSVSILHSDQLHLQLNVIAGSLCSIDCSWLLSVLPDADSFSNTKMRTFSRIHTHQSTREIINKSLWRRKTKPASFNAFGVVVLAPNKICGAFPWRVSVFSVLWKIMLQK